MRFHLTILALVTTVIAALALPRWLNPPLPTGPAAPVARVTPNRAFTPPVVTVDKLHVRDLVDARDFAALDALFRDLQERFLRDVREETDLFVALETFDTADAAVGAALDAWVANVPTSAFARLARAQYRVRQAWDRRGERIIRDTSGTQLKGMSESLDGARTDARAAIERNPRLAAAYAPLIRAARMDEGLARCGEVSRAALAIAPASYELRAVTMLCLLPRWGGSYEMMDEFAYRSTKWRDQNPRLDALGGFSAWDRGRLLAEKDEQFADAVRAYNRAIEYGDDWHFYQDRGEALWRLDRREDALPDYERAAALRPQSAEVRVQRALLLATLKRSDDRAKADVAAVARLDPTSDALEWYERWPIREVESQGRALLDQGKIDEAIATFTRAHEMGPGKSDALSERSAAWVKKNDYDRALADLEADIEFDPRRFISYQRIDWILSHKAAWDRIIGYWDRYLTLEPNDSRAYMERGGAYSQKGDRQHALFDAKKACELGDEKGCQLSKRF